MLASVSFFAQATGNSWDLPANIAFGIISVIAIGAALRMVTTNNVVHSALYLLIVLASVAAVYILLGAEFAAATQVLVYIGAIVVLFLFGIMLTRAKVGAEDGLNHDNVIPAVLTAILLLIVMAYAVVDFAKLPGRDGAEEIDVIGGRLPTTVEQVSDSIFSTYIVAFEAISVLLLAALIGAIVVARKE